ncbi:MAG: MlaC/ttg2D family ABC transporter substrate-binding protein [Kiloniellales bacterium]
MEQLRDQAVDQLSDANLPDDERAHRFEVLFDSHFDLPAIGRFVLGPYWRRADDAEREAFMAVFEDVMVNRFAPLFAGLDRNKLQIGEARPDGANATLFMVPTTVLRDEGEPYSIGWRLRTLDGGFKVVDVVPEGVSMAITLRSEYTSAIQSNGGKVAAFTEQLRKKVARSAKD